MNRLLTTLCAIMLAAVSYAEDVTTETLRIVPGVWASDDAKIAAWVWGDNVEAGWTALFTGDGDTLSTTINAQADSLIFVRFNSSVTEPTWEDENKIWNRTDNLAIDHQSLVYAITGWDSSEWVTTASSQTDPEPNPSGSLPTVALAGTMNEWDIEANVLTPDADNLSASVTVSLAVADYEFKIVVDGNWLSLNGEGSDLYTLHRAWNSASNVNMQGANNFKLTADVAGEYIFTWTYADNTITITFPEYTPVVDDHTYYLVGNSAELGAWNPSDALLMENNTITLNLSAGTYAIKVLTEEKSWETALTYSLLNNSCSSAGLSTDSDGNTRFTLDESGAVTVSVENEQLCVTGSFNVPEPGQYTNYAALINHNRFVNCEAAGDGNMGYAQYKAQVQLGVGDTLRIINRVDGNNVMQTSLDSYGENDKFDHDTYGYYHVCREAGCYHVYYNSSNSLYISSGTDCSEGEPYDGSILPTATVRISISDDGLGEIIVDGHYYAQSFSQQYVIGSVITVEVYPSTVYQFLQWSDGMLQQTRTIEVTGDVNLTAEIAKQTDYLYGVLVNSTLFIRSTHRDDNQYTVRAQLEQGDTIQLMFAGYRGGVQREIWMSTLEPYGENTKFDEYTSLGYMICNTAGCYDIYIKLGQTRSVYIGEGSVCSRGENVNDIVLETLPGHYLYTAEPGEEFDFNGDITALSYGDNNIYFSAGMHKIYISHVSYGSEATTISASCSSSALFKLEGFTAFLLKEPGNVNINIDYDRVIACINGNFSWTYSAVGDSALFGTSWDTGDTRTEFYYVNDELWTYKMESVTLQAGTYEYKVISNHSWDITPFNGWETLTYPSSNDNYTITIPEDGIYDILFSLSPGNECTAEPELKQSLQDLCPIASGTCGASGENLTWVLGCDSVLTISGEGEMPSSYSGTSAPWYQYGQAIKHINIEEGVTKLALYAFYNSDNNYPNVQTLSIPSTLGAPIENNFFYSCPLKTVTINSDTIVGKASYTSGSSLQNKFGAQVEQYIIGGSVRSIANFAFRNQDNDSLRSIILPEGLEAIGNWAFGYIEHLTSISIPSTVQTIGTDAFAYCTNLRSIELGEGLTNIDGQAFWMCDNLTNVTSYSLNPPSLSSTTFDHYDTLYVPCEAKDNYKQADYWQNFNLILCPDDTIGGYTEPDVPEQLTFTLSSSWQFIMLPTVFGLEQDDIIIDGEIAWAVYDSQWRAEGRSGWKAFNPVDGFSASRTYIVRARNGSATLTIRIPDQAREKAGAAIPFAYNESSHSENANWNFLGNPYPFSFNITSALDAQGIESPIAVWNGIGYDMFTPGIDQKILSPFEAFFIQMPDNGAEVIQFVPDYIDDSSSTNTGNNSVADADGALPGYFTINTSKQKVQFSRGNLQYQASTATWQFAENQYEVVGDGNANISSTYDGWIDLFGWGTGNNPTKTSTSKCDYSSFVDWGINAISNGGNTENMWRTLSANEWTYITGQRTNCDSLCGRATVCGIKGFILLPDDWVSPGVPFKGSENQGYELNQYSLEDWQKMEAAGAVFLPECGSRTGTEFSIGGVQYWSTNDGTSCYAYDIITAGASDYKLKTNQIGRHGGYGVRLVK